jgi:hypothetical protein
LDHQGIGQGRVVFFDDPRALEQLAPEEFDQ